MSKLHDRELADTKQTEALKRKRRGKKKAAVTNGQAATASSDPRWLRVRAACCDEHPPDIDVDGHAARIVLTILETSAAVRPTPAWARGDSVPDWPPADSSCGLQLRDPAGGLHPPAPVSLESAANRQPRSTR